MQQFINSKKENRHASDGKSFHLNQRKNCGKLNQPKRYQIRDISCISEMLNYQECKIIFIKALIVPDIYTCLYGNCSRCKISFPYGQPSNCPKCHSINVHNVTYKLKVQLIDATATFCGYISDANTEKLLGIRASTLAKKGQEELIKIKNALLFNEYTFSLKITKNIVEVNDICI